ncbi:MAG: hypothetical protein FWF00_05035 [Endomicrobia bacterium]|nr:hypothetical protein [Endomicrobiia bacterium]MCL2507032.1 hypothetical protein [Endomicrobiia bacterium]
MFRGNFFFNNFLKCSVSKLLALSIVFFIIFNSFLVLGADKIKSVYFCEAQKDIFSVVFFVSDTINKMSDSVSGKIIPQNTQSDFAKHQDKNVPIVGNKIYVINNYQPVKTDIYGSNPFITTAKINVFANAPPGNQEVPYFIVVYFLAMLMLFASVKKLYNNVLINQFTYLYKPSNA